MEDRMVFPIDKDEEWEGDGFQMDSSGTNIRQRRMEA
jgi:hypothetical protein